MKVNLMAAAEAAAVAAAEVPEKEPTPTACIVAKVFIFCSILNIYL